MLNWIIDFALRHRALVIVTALALAVGGGVSMHYLDIDAFPDTTPVQVQINPTAPALGPEEVEQRITAPIEQSLSGLPGLELVRSVSKFGLSQVVVTFKDGTTTLGTVTLPAKVRSYCLAMNDSITVERFRDTVYSMPSR